MQKMLLFAGIGMLLATAGHAQTDTTANTPDTVRIGDMIIVKKKDPSSTSKTSTSVTWNKNKRPKRVETSWFTFDIGFNNYRDDTRYGSAAAQAYAPGLGASDFELNNGKSVNVNIWLFRQKYGIDRNRVLQLTYGMMLELNNYRYESDISYKKNPAMVIEDNISFSKNKLAADYITVPLMIGFNTKPGTNRGFTMSGGVSIGYLYNSRNKQVSDERGKTKTKGSLGLEPWKFQYIAEVGLGPVKLYGSYAPHSMYKNGLDIQPYNFGLRLGDW